MLVPIAELKVFRYATSAACRNILHWGLKRLNDIGGRFLVLSQCQFLICKYQSLDRAILLLLVLFAIGQLT